MFDLNLRLHFKFLQLIRRFHSDCAECGDHALRRRAVAGQPPRSQVGPTGEKPRHGAAGGEPARHRPAPPQGHLNAGLPRAPQGEARRQPRPRPLPPAHVCAGPN